MALSLGALPILGLFPTSPTICRSLSPSLFSHLTTDSPLSSPCCSSHSPTSRPLALLPALHIFRLLRSDSIAFCLRFRQRPTPTTPFPPLQYFQTCPASLSRRYRCSRVTHLRVLRS
ncbi:hypothetical protein BC827DRAFT_921716 [Russula dissimulans]|nr:hypothetical protein BC827DRAFT_921716 [Russula dissimulans]